MVETGKQQARGLDGNSLDSETTNRLHGSPNDSHGRFTACLHLTSPLFSPVLRQTITAAPLLPLLDHLQPHRTPTNMFNVGPLLTVTPPPSRLKTLAW